jgi:hypothetical protein
MQCPHCSQHFFSKARRFDLGVCGEDHWSITLETCPNCIDGIVTVSRLEPLGKRTVTMIYPKGTPRASLSCEIPEAIAQDYREAASLLEESPNASAAFGRRCLRSVLEHCGFRKDDLNAEIDTLIASKQVPRIMAEWLDAVRTIGKFREHPLKSTHAAEIHSVEPGEAEAILDALDGLFEFYFVQPAEMRRKRDELMAKLNMTWRPVETVPQLG